MEYEVTQNTKPLNLYATGVEEILQNVYMILNTPKGSVPLNRSFGLDLSPLDMPIEIAKNLMTSNILEALQDFEPRATLIKVEYIQNHEIGKLEMKVRVKLDNESI